jgi:histidine ammonia-lyase
VAQHVVAIELLCASQAIDLLAPLPTSPPLARVVAAIRAQVPTLEHDRPISRDMQRIAHMIERGEVERASGVKVN